MSQTRPSNVLYIRTPPEMGDRELEQLCRAEAGFVILRKMRFFSFAEYATIDDATRAMRHLSQQSWRGVPLSVDFDKDRVPGSQQLPVKQYQQQQQRVFERRSRSRSRSRSPSRSRRHRRSSSAESGSRSRSPSRSHRHTRSPGASPAEEPAPVLQRARNYMPAPQQQQQQPPMPAMYPSQQRESLLTIPGVGTAAAAAAMLANPAARLYSPFGTLFGPAAGAGAGVGVGVGVGGGGTAVTLFVHNLPKDVTEREVSLLFRFVPGYVGCRLVRRDHPFAFVDFADTATAYVALNSLSGYRIDRDSDPLMIEFDAGSRERGRR